MSDTLQIPRHFRTARLEMQKSRRRIKLGAVIVRGGNIIGRGKNDAGGRSTLKGIYGSRSTHAEVAAVMSVKDPKNLRGTCIYVYREANRLPANARPCQACREFLQAHGIRKMYYTCESGFAVVSL